MPPHFGVPVPSIAPAALADKLRALPQWGMGMEEPGLARYLSLAALGSGDSELTVCGAGLACWSWQRAPFDPTRAALVGNAMPGSSAAAFCAALDRRMACPVDAEGLSALLACGDASLIVRVLLPRLREPSGCLTWMAQAWDGLLRLGSADLARAALEACRWPSARSVLRARLTAEAEFLYGSPETALKAVDAFIAIDAGKVFAAYAMYLRAQVLLRLGERRAGLSLLTELFAAMPWHVNLGLKLHALAAPLPVAPAEAAGRAVILVYSWNKAELARRTLESLAGTDMAGARVLALDNGSTDGTGAAMESCRGLFSEGTMRVLRLPVNIGAPAARNWLLAQPETLASDYAVFLDDDVVLPERWLLRLLGALEADPGAGAAGCRIVSAMPPPCLQSADYQLFAPAGEPRTFRDLPENVGVFDNCAGALDIGLFSYARPATHVSGCCHALRTGLARSLGGFDIRFGPTQFDDLDRDLTSAAAGHPAVYAGDVAVAHVQHSSLARAKSAAATGQVLGNKIKLEGKHGGGEMARLHHAGLAALWDDLARKWRELGS